MAIPQYEQQVTPDATQATAPEELHPVAAAFGGDIGAALEKGGDEIQNRIDMLTGHMARMLYFQQQSQVQDKLNQFNEWKADKLYNVNNNADVEIPKTWQSEALNPNNTTLSAGGSPQSNTATPDTVTVPYGLLQRKGWQAAGALHDLDTSYQAQKAQITLQARQEGLGQRAISNLTNGLDQAWSSDRMNVVKHEAEQRDQAQQQTFLKGMQLQADSAVGAQDPISLARKIDSINQANDALNDQQGKDKDDPIRELTSNKFIGQALNNSMVTNLKATGGNPAQFQSTLDKLHDDGKINDTVYESAQEHLDRASKAIISQNASAAKEQQVNVRMDAFNKLAQGKFDISNQSLIDEYASKDPELGNALQTVAESRGQYKPERNDAQNREFQKSVTAMINSSSQDQLSGYMTKLLSDKNGISQTHLNVMVNALMNHAKTLPAIDGQPNSPVTQNTSAMAFNALSSWADRGNLSPDEKTDLITHYLDGMTKTAPKQNYDNAIKSHMMQAYPQTATMEFPPTDIDAEGRGFNKAVNFAADAKIYPQQRLNMHGTEEKPGSTEEASKIVGKKIEDIPEIKND